jgi:hypothetical protein
LPIYLTGFLERGNRPETRKNRNSQAQCESHGQQEKAVFWVSADLG